MGRPPCCDRSTVKKGLWTPEEDAKILAYVSNHGVGNWTLVPKKAGLNRCGKSCRLRWTNYLRPDLKHDNFTPQEEDLIINLHKAIGSRWSCIAKKLPGRTDNDVKNYWNTKLKKKLRNMGIDPITHKPFSQMFSDFGNITGINSNVNLQINTTCFNKSVLTNFNLPKPEPISSVLVSGQVDDNFLSQFQVQPTIFCNDVSSSCSSSASTPLTPTSSYIWNDFLLNEPVDLSMEIDQEQLDGQDHFAGMLESVTTKTSTLMDDVMGYELNNSTGSGQVKFSRSGGDGDFWSFDYGVNNIICDDQGSSSSACSFVDGILDRDKEIVSLFPLLPSFD